MLIDISYFTEGSRQIENAAVNPTTSNSRAVNERIEGYISTYEYPFYKDMLGKEVADQMMEAEEGIFVVIKDKLKESFADFVFFHILRNMNFTATVTGLVKLKCANEYVSPIDMQVEAWNRMVENNRQFVEWAKTDACPIGIRVSKHMVSPINTLNL